MTAKDKAKQLYFGLGILQVWSDKNGSLYDQKLRSKHSAIVSVNEIIKELEDYFIDTSLDRILYWKEVINEIKKI